MIIVKELRNGLLGYMVENTPVICKLLARIDTDLETGVQTSEDVAKSIMLKHLTQKLVPRICITNRSMSDPMKISFVPFFDTDNPYRFGFGYLAVTKNGDQTFYLGQEEEMLEYVKSGGLVV